MIFYANVKYLVCAELEQNLEHPTLFCTCFNKQFYSIKICRRAVSRFETNKLRDKSEI